MNERLAKAIERYHAKNDALWALMAPIEPVLPYRYKRWSELNLDPRSAVYWTAGRKQAWVHGKPANCGLRLVGHVPPEAGRGYRHGRYFMKHDEVGQLGWFTDPDGYHYKNGDGLIWGVVLQLPGRKRMARLVAGFHVGGNDEVQVDLSRIWEENCGGGDAHQPLEETDAAHDAAFAADAMAEEFADEEREYQLQHREEEEDDDGS